LVSQSLSFSPQYRCRQIQPEVTGNAWIENRPTPPVDQSSAHLPRRPPSTNRTSQKTSSASARTFASDIPLTPITKTPSAESARSNIVRWGRHVPTVPSGKVTHIKSFETRVLSSSSDTGSFRNSSNSDNF